MKGYKVRLCYFDKKKEHAINIRKYMILLKRKVCLAKKSVLWCYEQNFRQVKTSLNRNMMCGHDQTKNNCGRRIHFPTPVHSLSKGFALVILVLTRVNRQDEPH